MIGFFNPRDSFGALVRTIPTLFTGKTCKDFVRVWVPACECGEFAYSIAILLLDAARRFSDPPGIQVFACDPDPGKIEVARAGVYPQFTARSVDRSYLRRFFAARNRRYHVKHELRKVVLFAVHDAASNASFARMDLVACGNLLHPANPAPSESHSQSLSERLRFALKDRGLLFAGARGQWPAEMDGFATIDARHQIFRRKPFLSPDSLRTLDSDVLLRALDVERQLRQAGQIPSASDLLPAPSSPSDRLSALSESGLRDLEQALPACAVVNGAYRAVHISNQAWAFLEPGADPSRPFLSLLPRPLRPKLRSALLRAIRRERPVIVPRVPMRLQKISLEVEITIAPSPQLGPALYVVSFARLPSINSRQPGPPPTPATPMIENELQLLRDQLQNSENRFLMGRAELKARNEQLQALNARLSVATEELEVSQQELLSLNEELTAVNRELSETIKHLEGANSDLSCFLDAFAIPAVLLDPHLKIARFTAAATALFRLLPTDVGRPLRHLRAQLKDESIFQQASKTLKSRQPFQSRVQDVTGRSYLANTLPWLDAKSRLRGIVLTFFEIKDHKAPRRQTAASSS